MQHRHLVWPWLAAGFAGLFALSAQASDLKVLSHIPAGGEGGWDYANVDPANHKLYVTRGASVMAFNLKTRVTTLRIAPAAGGHTALPINGGGELLITNGLTQTATIVSAATGALRATIATGPKPDAAVFEPTSGLVIVMGNRTGEMTLIDPRSGVGVGVITVGGALEFAVADGAGRVFVNVQDKGELVAVDIKARKVIGRYKLEGCEDPSGLAYDGARKLLLSACANGVAKVTSAIDGKAIASLTIGPRPDAALYDSVRKIAYIPSGGGEGTLSVIDLDGAGGPKVVQTLRTAPGARLGAIDPRTGHVYLPAAKYAPAATPGGRPSMIPGSFELIEIGK